MKIFSTSRAVGLPGTGGRIAEVIQRALSAAGLTRGIPVNVKDDTDCMRSPAALGHQSSEDEAGEIQARGRAGQFVSRTYSNAAGTRAYKLFIPSRYSAERVPLVVMLHGCTQNPDDFATGTRMNEFAAKQGVLVVYPAQAAKANGSKCWNWFKRTDQQRDLGEPSLIAGITRELAATYPVDQHRIFVAGLSAGAAMAVILGQTYPELFAAVGAHSGMPYGAAHDVPSAFAAMRGGGSSVSRATSSRRPRIKPTIVFHGDADATVHATNGAAIVADALAFEPGPDGPLFAVREKSSVRGQEYTATFYRDSNLRPLIEDWVVHGAGHAWSGGSSMGSHTEARGPDASAQMLRFFLAQDPQ